MAVFFWYRVKSDLFSVRYCTSVHWSHFVQGTRKTRPCLTGHPVGKLRVGRWPAHSSTTRSLNDWTWNLSMKNGSKEPLSRLIRWPSYCFPIEKTGRQDFMHNNARPSINKHIKNRKTMRGARFNNQCFGSVWISFILTLRIRISFMKQILIFNKFLNSLYKPISRLSKILQNYQS